MTVWCSFTSRDYLFYPHHCDLAFHDYLTMPFIIQCPLLFLKQFPGFWLYSECVSPSFAKTKLTVLSGFAAWCEWYDISDVLYRLTDTRQRDGKTLKIVVFCFSRRYDTMHVDNKLGPTVDVRGRSGRRRHFGLSTPSNPNQPYHSLCHWLPLCLSSANITFTFTTVILETTFWHFGVLYNKKKLTLFCDTSIYWKNLKWRNRSGNTVLNGSSDAASCLRTTR